MKKVATILLVIAMLVAMATPALASSNSQIVNSPTSRTWQDGFGFHCNNAKGNGATAVEYLGDTASILNLIAGIKKQPAGSLIVEKGDQKDIFGTKTFPITLERVDTSTLWDLKTEDIKCKTCGRTDWITYSNNSGVINGKNIQAHHSPTPPAPPEFKSSGSFRIVKTIEGQPINEWALDNGYDIDDYYKLINELSFVATGNGLTQKGVLGVDGYIDFGIVPVGNYTITETITGAALDIFVHENGVVSSAFFVGEKGVEAKDVSYISGKDFGKIITAGIACPEGGANRNWDLPAVWNGFFAGSQYAGKFAELRAMGAQWVWDVEDTYIFGINGGTFKDEFTFIANEDGTAKAYFAADNVAVIYLNDKLIGYTTVALRNSLTIGADYDENVLGKLKFADFDGRWSEGWNHLYEIDIPYAAGENTIKVIAANSVSTKFDEVRSGTDNDTYDLTNNPCGLIFGFVLPGATFDNELVANPYGTVSFTKTKYGGQLDVAPGEFEFDLFKIENGIEIYVDTFETGFNGTVTAGDLPVGSYVFREVIKVDHDTIPGQEGTFGYRFVWNPEYPGGADGLYFEIDNKGDVTWEYGGNDPVVNNEYACKHKVQWSPLDWAGQPNAVPYDSGWLVYGSCKTNFTFDTEKSYGANCVSPGMLYYSCVTCYDGHGTALPGDALDCDMIVTEDYASYCGFHGYKTEICSRCEYKVVTYDEEFTAHDWVPGNPDKHYLYCDLCGVINTNEMNPEFCWTCLDDPCVCDADKPGKPEDGLGGTGEPEEEAEESDSTGEPEEETEE